MPQYVALGIAVLALIVSCYGMLDSRYQISTPSTYSSVYRVDTRTGQITYFELNYSHKELNEMTRTSKEP
jgi:hypothetical protein